MIDCFIIGHNDGNFLEYEKMVRTMGPKSGAFRDLNLHYVELDGKPYRAMDLLNQLHFEEAELEGDLPRELAVDCSRKLPSKQFYNGDFLSPAILCLGTFLDKHGYTFDYVNSFDFEKERLQEQLQRNDIRTIAITTTLYVSVKPIVEIVSFIRKYNQTAKIVIGGPFIATQFRQADNTTIQYMFKALGADFYVNNIEGEQALVNILHALKNGTGFAEIDNVWFKSGNQYVNTGSSEENNDLEENPVKWNLFPKEQIGEFVSVRSSRSCPFSCAFCGFPERAGTYRYTSVAAIERELDALKEVGTVTSLSFIDDTFNVPKERFKEILRMMIKNKYGFRWHFNFRCQFADEESVALMKEAGCEGVFLGIESGSEEILANMNKKASAEQYRQGLGWLNQYGILSYASFIVGFPGETDATVLETVKFIEENRPTYYRTQLWYCDPLTPIWRQRETFGIKGSMFQWSHKTMNYEQACEHIERIFKTIKHSIWLPQNSFEIFSLFYLQRKGMSLEQINQFLGYFNRLVAMKLGESDNREEILAGVRRACRF